jgi:hypothetical protein
MKIIDPLPSGAAVAARRPDGKAEHPTARREVGVGCRRKPKPSTLAAVVTARGYSSRGRSLVRG